MSKEILTLRGLLSRERKNVPKDSLKNRRILLMASKQHHVLAVVMLFALAGCGVTYMPRYEQVGAIAPGQVLVVSRVEVHPEVQQQKDIEKIFAGRNAIKRGEVHFLTSPNADKPVKKGAMMPFDVKGGYEFNVSFQEFSFTLMPAGTTFIRRGDIAVGRQNKAYSSSGGAPQGVHAGFRDVYLWGDVTFTIPAGAKAVYIGTLVYQHDGRYSTNVSVRDDFENAKRALEKQKIPGIRSADLKKVLAKVVNPN